MDANVIPMVVMSVVGCLFCAAAIWLGGRYYEKRFGKQLYTSLKKRLSQVVACSFAGAVFASYSYSIIEAMALLIFIAGTFVIGGIDREEQIIPNRILVIMFAVRSILYLADIILGMEYAVDRLMSGLFGLLFYSGLFMVFRLVYKEKIGMGDIKTIMLAGYYIGIYRCCLMLLIILIISVVHMIYRIIRKQLCVRDSVSFGPYIAVGGYMALILGI